MPKTIRVGVITQAEGAHLPDYFDSLAKAEEVESVSLADASGKIEPVARKALAARLKDTYKDADTLLKQAQPQMVIVSMESVLAPPAIDAALEAGCHVVAEKPSCVRAADMERLVKKAQAKHRHLMLAMPNRLHAPVREARRLVQDGLLGKIYGLEVHLVADQTRLKDEAYRKEWFCSKARAGGGTLAWLGILWLDTALYIAGQKAQQVAGFAGLVGGQPVDIEDSAAMTLRLDNGSFGVMTAGYYLDKGYQSHIQVWGENGWLRLAAVEEEPLEWYSSKGVKDAKVQRFEYAKGGRGFPAFIRAAVRASAGLEEPPITSDETLQVVKTVYAFYEAARSGRTQNVSG
jgi:predicted dehydrogenase